MSKTQLDPTGVQQLKKLFVECETDGNVKLRYGRVKLASGKRMVSFGKDFVPINIQVTSLMRFDADPSDDVAPYYYSINMINNNSFTIVSSDTADTSEVMYLVLGG
jgi:hypothetical protein